MVDRAHFPSDTMSTHFIQAPGMLRLSRWDLLDDLSATGCPAIMGGVANIAGVEIEMEFPDYEGVPGLMAPRRTILDKLLVDAAVDAGAELAEGVSVDGLIFEDDRVVGVRGHTSEGSFEERARFVVGADGRNSVVASNVGAEFVHHMVPQGVGYYSYFADVELRGTEFYFFDDLFCVTFPTHDDLITIAALWPGSDIKDLKSDVEGNFYAALDRLGTLGERVRAGSRAERFVGASDIPNFIRRPFGPGWALAGDAYYQKDPTPADGISDAFRAADLLSVAIDDSLSDPSVEVAAMTRYQTEHDAIALPLMERTIEISDPNRTPQQRAESFINLRITDGEEIDKLNEQHAAA
jgi:flavin-dependent dehydrogenase